MNINTGYSIISVFQLSFVWNTLMSGTALNGLSNDIIQLLDNSIELVKQGDSDLQSLYRHLTDRSIKISRLEG